MIKMIQPNFDIFNFFFFQLFADEPFDPEDYVERLSWRIGGLQPNSENFDPSALHKAFEHAIYHLEQSYETKQRQCNLLETICREEEKSHWEKVRELIEKNKVVYNLYQFAFMSFYFKCFSTRLLFFFSFLIKN